MKRVAKFNANRGEDYALWFMRFEALMESEKLLDTVLRDTKTEFTPVEIKVAGSLKRAKVRRILVQGLRDRPLRKVS